ncbi:MAG: aldolase/citrate lyase family protein [Dehalococcoidales bacterium]|jgi:2-keto-3-deoxy-L-rhamnonate aldolase RhmA|nr:aldolase/citrate lyase family protein [Dehalococcoidales bacterium]MDP7415434.1 aldolase/citrate lyase family protein [Dehalococcoidales bacterium]
MKNLLKEKVKKGEITIGTIVSLGHPDVTEWLSQVGYDWLFLDAEHGAMGLETLQQMMQSMKGANCTPVVRPQWNDHALIKRILDIGAHGIIVPMVSSKEEAKNAVRACKYPPAGIRGFGPRRAAMFDPDYLETANDETLTIVLIETEAAIRNIDEILSVEGIDVGFMGYDDLSLSMGFGQPPKWHEPRYLEAFDKVIKAANKRGKVAGLHTNLSNSPGNVYWALDRGFRMVTVSDADTFIIQGAQTTLEKAREAAAKVKPFQGRD